MYLTDGRLFLIVFTAVIAGRLTAAFIVSAIEIITSHMADGDDDNDDVSPYGL